MAMTPAPTTALTTAPTTAPTTAATTGRTSGRTAGATRGACDRPCAGLCRPDGFAAAHRAHRPWLLTRLRALLGDRGAAEDAVQETFLRAWSACRSFDPTAGPSLATWIGTIGRNVAIDALRARSVRPRLTVEADESAERVCQSRPVDAALQRMVLLDALAGVSPEHRGVVLQAVVRDRPYADVAAALDIPVGTVKSRVHHALRGMRRTLDRTELAA
jgi:RNA polymerase sigma-70 factor (ECF subfamily)